MFWQSLKYNDLFGKKVNQKSIKKVKRYNDLFGKKVNQKSIKKAKRSIKNQSKNVSKNVGFMGRIKTKDIKRIARELVEKQASKFSPDFKHNKEVLKEMGIGDTQIMRNKIAGAIVRSVRLKKF